MNDLELRHTELLWKLRQESNAEMGCRRGRRWVVVFLWSLGEE